jgi:hypothetical protein
MNHTLKKKAKNLSPRRKDAKNPAFAIAFSLRLGAFA